MRLRRCFLLLATVCVSNAACSSNNQSPVAPPSPPPTDAGAGADDAAMALPFEADPPTVYVAKVKNLLVGLPPTDDEIATVTNDPTALKTLITSWMQLPQYTQKMERFFELAFQQTQLTVADLADQAYPRQVAINASTAPLLLQNLQQSFARTMLSLIADGKPLSAAMTTRTLMMTTALKELYAFLDVWQVDDNGKVTDRFKQANPKLQITVGAAAGPIPIADTLNPASANYMHWYDPDVATLDSSVAGCAVDPVVYPPSALTLHWLLYGSLDNHKTPDGASSCSQVSGSAAAPQLSAADFADWSPVTIRQPMGGETVTPFYDLPTLRTASELVLAIPRVGFFTTPAFFANWQTNVSNQMRVTMNQTLIVALGAQVDGTDPTHTPGTPPPGLDTVHASEGACLVCHQTLDPLRSIFSATYSWNYHEQADATLGAQKGMFAFQGVTAPVATIHDLGDVLAGHPLLPAAWVQKLCTYATSAACDPTDPELQRLVSVFTSSGLSWNTLVTELFSSPLTTNAAPTQTATTSGVNVSVARRDHLCAAWSARLGLPDVCGLAATTKKQTTITQIASGLPSDGYGRGATMPVLPDEPTLFYRAGTENMCAAVAAQVIDVASTAQTSGVKYWSSKDPDTAIADFVSLVMGLVPSDPRSGPASDLLKGHFSAAMQQGANATNALKSTFVTACLAPSAVSIGM